MAIGERDVVNWRGRERVGVSLRESERDGAIVECASPAAGGTMEGAAESDPVDAAPGKWGAGGGGEEI